MKRISLVLALVLAFFTTATTLVYADASCSFMSSVRSNNSNTPSVLTFVNKTPEGRNIVWIDFTGQQKQYKYLKSGRSWTVNTYLTHPWLVTDGPGNCYGIYMSRGSSRTVVLTRWGQGGGD